MFQEKSIMPVLLPSAECAMEIDSAPEISNGAEVKQLCPAKNFKPESPNKLIVPLTQNFILKTCKERILSKHREKTKNYLKSFTETSSQVKNVFLETKTLQKKLQSFLKEKDFLFSSPVESILIHPNYQNFSELNNYPDIPNGRVSPPLPPPHRTMGTEGLEVVSFSKGQNFFHDLPPPGELVRTPLDVGAKVYAMKSNFLEEFLPATVVSVRDNMMYKISFDISKSTKLYSAKYLAYTSSSKVTLNVKTRIIARYDDGGVLKMYAGTIAEEPKPLNRGRYLIFFDDGYAQYMQHKDIHVMCAQSEHIHEDVDKGMQTFIRNYFAKYPERPMVKVQKNQIIRTEFNNSWWDAKVAEVDASMAYMYFKQSGRYEWIYRGSTRLEPLYSCLNRAEENRNLGRVRRHNIVPRKPDQPYVEFTNDEADKKGVVTLDSDSDGEGKTEDEKRPQRKVPEQVTAPVEPEPMKKPVKNTARKSMGGKQTINYLNVTTPTSVRKPDVKSMIGYKDIENMNSFYRVPYVPHECSIKCREKLDPAAFKGVNPFRKPSHAGWERQIRQQKLLMRKFVMYRAPCGRHLRNLQEILEYLVVTKSRLTIDQFTIDPYVHTFQYFRPKDIMYQNSDISNGKENVPIACVNIWSKAPPDIVPYTANRCPGKDVPLNLDKEFLSGCSCTDNCMTSGKCDCQAITNYAHHGNEDLPSVGYKYRRLKDAVITGIFECNEWCSCGPQCGNRVVQNGLQVRLQMFMTMNKGWGVRCLDDIPEGMFICIYAGQLLNEDRAEMDGNQFGDEYLAELDHIEVAENLKRGYEENVDFELMDVDDRKSSGSSAHPASSDSENDDSGSDCESFLGKNTSTYSRNAKKYSGADPLADNPAHKSFSFKYSSDSLSITPRALSPESMDYIEHIKLRIPKISDHDSPNNSAKKKSSSKHTAPLEANSAPREHKPTRDYFNEEGLYIMDAKTMGNIGKYLNHSCTPNCFVQNVFVDTHDLRFPQIAFFTSSFVTAGTELTWDYNYDVGSVKGKVLICYCDSRNCRGRLL